MWVMSRIWMGHVPHRQIWTHHVTHTNEPCHIACMIPHIQMSEPCEKKKKWVMSENESYPTNACPAQTHSLQKTYRLCSATHKLCSATHCNTLQHTAITATPCNTLQHSACAYPAQNHSSKDIKIVFCYTRQHTATQCNTLQHTATQRVYIPGAKPLFRRHGDSVDRGCVAPQN